MESDWNVIETVTTKNMDVVEEMIRRIFPAYNSEHESLMPFLRAVSGRNCHPMTGQAFAVDCGGNYSQKNTYYCIKKDKAVKILCFRASREVDGEWDIGIVTPKEMCVPA